MSDFKQLSDFPSTAAVQPSDYVYSQNVTTGLEQKTTAQQLQNFVMAGIAAQPQSIPVLGNGQAVYVTQGYTPQLLNVFVAGVRLNPSQYQALDGVNVIITDPTVLAELVPGMTVDLDVLLAVSVGNAATPASVAALDPGNQPPVGQLTGLEITSIRQGAGLFQISLTRVAQWILQVYNGFTQSGTGTTGRTIQSKLQDQVSVLDFPVDPTGVNDSTASLQLALNSFGQQGGTLYIPWWVKLYVAGNLTIPPNVTLKGSHTFVGVMTSNSMTSNYAALGGSIALANTVTISISGGASLEGMLVYQYGMTFPATDSSGFAGTAVTIAGDEAAVRESMILGFNQAIMGNGFSKLSFLGVRFDCNNGINISNSGDVCHIDRCHGWSYAVFRPGVTALQLQRSGSAYSIQNSNDWTKFRNSFSYGFLTGFQITNAQSVSFAQCAADNTANGYGTGFAITGTSADIELIGCQAAAQTEGFFFNNPGFATRMTGCTTWGNTTHGINIVAGDVTIVGGLVRNSPNGISLSSSTSNVDVADIRMDSSVTVPLNVTVATTNLRVRSSNDFTNFPAANALIGTPANVTLPVVASAGTMSLPWTGDAFNISGTTSFGTLYGGYAGRRVTLIFQGALSVFNSTGAQTAMRLSTAATFSAVAGSTLTLLHNGTQWTEVGRCV